MLFERFGRAGRIYRLPIDRRSGTRVGLRVGTSDFATFTQVLVRDELSGLRLSGVRTVLDAGANIGLAAVRLAELFPNATIVCVEPDAANIDVLKKNTAVLAPRVKIVCGAVWGRAGVMEISNPASEHWARQVEEAPSGTIEAWAISDLAREFAGGAFDVVKMDIEGAERQVFRAELSWLDSVRLVAVELHDWMVPGCKEAVLPAFGDGWKRERSGEYDVFRR